jgi:hypothetical protein
MNSDTRAPGDPVGLPTDDVSATRGRTGVGDRSVGRRPFVRAGVAAVPLVLTVKSRVALAAGRYPSKDPDYGKKEEEKEKKGEKARKTGREKARKTGHER